MLSRLHNKLGTAGLVVAIVALVAALTGAAFAAGGLTKQQEKQVRKIAKKFAGKRGPKGPTGPAGPQGPAGPAGKDGTNGTNGTNGSNGKSVVIGTATAGECPSGGSTISVEGSTTKKSVCNGKTGFTETLPAGKTETGAWLATESEPQQSISFNIPLPEGEIPTFNVIAENGAAKVGDAANCEGSAEAPTAKAGNVCLYVATGLEASFNGIPLVFVESEQGFAFAASFGPGGAAIGTWAVTA